ncbi:hypothetical protein, partial [Xanthomonas perforans]|uniref:hypothetical protein n=1 Tax=Xanthomonas perforans TaxID=442694 RepID=UPI001F36F49F
AAATTPVARKVRRSIIGDFRLCTSFDLSFSNGEASYPAATDGDASTAHALALSRLASKNVETCDKRSWSTANGSPHGALPALASYR